MNQPTYAVLVLRSEDNVDASYAPFDEQPLATVYFDANPAIKKLQCWQPFKLYVPTPANRWCVINEGFHCGYWSGAEALQQQLQTLDLETVQPGLKWASPHALSALATALPYARFCLAERTPPGWV